ncbi:flavodoxin domain-containing protein [Actinomycetes bacterium KLBMP 9797]
MRAVVVFDSMFGNTRQVAEAITDGVSLYADTTLLPVDEAAGRLDETPDLLVVGGPTHGHGLSNRASRRPSPKQVAQGAVFGRVGLREFLGLVSLPVDHAVDAATFDTRFDKPAWLTGSAARRAARRLRQRGCRLVAPPESFFVDTAAGPPHAGELERARQWGAELGRALAARHVAA